MKQGKETFDVEFEINRRALVPKTAQSELGGEEIVLIRK